MKKYLLLLFLCIVTSGYTQNIEKDTIKKPLDQITLDALPYYNFGKGVGITAPDSLFQFNIRFRMQNRVEVLGKNDTSTNYQAMIRRLRLRFDGYVGNPQFTYAIQLSFSPDDVGELKEDSNINIIRDAVLFYKPTANWLFGFGQTKIPGNRQRTNSSGALQLTDRSINNATFNIDRDFGFQAYYLKQRKKRFGYVLKTAITTGEGRNSTDKNKGLAYTTRAELYPLGSFNKNGEYFEGDVLRENKMKLYLGGTYHYNDKAQRTKGQRGDLLYSTKDLQSIFLDMVLKYKGWAFTSAYMQRNVKRAITYNPTNISEISYVVAGKGADTQLSYTFLSNWEIIGRYSYQKPKKELYKANIMPKKNQYSIGLTKYIWEHSFKAQVEITQTNSTYALTEKENNWYVRFQVEIGI